ncbi:hypothetical protein U3516DRAFT_810038 [Neocallimastix sp. 'constans']
MFDATKLLKVLLLLSNYGRDVDSWINDFPKAKEAVEEDIQGVLNSLITKRGSEIKYPTKKEIQEAIEEYLKITESEKCSILKSLKISNVETIKKFNYRYKKLYNKLSQEYRKLITVKDYTNSISSRVFACSRVIVAECENVTEAFKIAEIAEDVEKEIISNTYQAMPYTGGTPMMITQTNINQNPILNHSIYGELINGQANLNYGLNYYPNNNTLFIATRRNDVPKHWGPNNDNYNIYNTPNPQYSGYNNGYYNNNNNYNMKNNTQLMPFGNFKNRSYNNRYNQNNYTTENSTFTVKGNSNNQFLNNNNMTSYDVNNSHMINNNNNIINGNSNDHMNNSTRRRNHNNASSGTIICHKCTMHGHKASECTYTYKQLADMEEKGLIKTPLNH